MAMHVKTEKRLEKIEKADKLVNQYFALLEKMQKVAKIGMYVETDDFDWTPEENEKWDSANVTMNEVRKILKANGIAS